MSEIDNIKPRQESNDQYIDIINRFEDRVGSIKLEWEVDGIKTAQTIVLKPIKGA